ncbi:hypothetical protein NC652_041774 [Populus alba x Populus x berolinensis]|nr:hypothetical protein NC652_041774 [Populus alba x Populus x berolinensis]
MQVRNWVFLVGEDFGSLWPPQQTQSILTPLGGCGVIMRVAVSLMIVEDNKLAKSGLVSVLGSWSLDLVLVLLQWFRFSCFSARIHSHKSKKTAQPSDEARHKSLEDLSHIQALPLTKSSRLILPKAQAGNQISNGVRDATRADVSVEQSWKSDKMRTKWMTRMTWEAIRQGLLGKNGLLRPDGSKDSGISTTSEHEKALQLGSFHGSYGFESYNYSALAQNWIMPVMDEVNLAKDLQGESSTQQWEELPCKDFKMKRIKDWVNNLQHFGPLEETNGLPGTDDPVKGDSNDLTSAKVDNKDAPGIEDAKRYISSLSVSATTAHLSNHELAVIPFLGVFGSLRMLNLSGNSIETIFPPLRVLRELTRLRVLDLSYNRIFRIGHGLASCSSLKELYLAANKISEVEGLHRLLKLSLLDLRFNKISTTKCLGQLAANYSSLQAISLEGNPAQKNVGDEQLKKYLQGLLPHLIYFNRQSIKASTLKDTADRSVRLGISSHQFDRGLRSDNKAVRKASHGLGGARPLPSSTHARKSQPVISTKRSSGRHLRSQTKWNPSNNQSSSS